MNPRLYMAASALVVANCLNASAADFFSTETPEQIFTLGARIGVNTSNCTIGEDSMRGYNVNSWGTGFDAGVVADIHIRDYISIQPGVFFQSRSGEFSYVTPFGNTNPVYLIQAGHWRSYWLSVPVLASFHFNISDDVRWDVELGPYFNFNMGSSRKNRVELTTGEGFVSDELLFKQKPKSIDAGVKIGTGIQLFDHYYFGIHYMAGLTGAWKDKPFETYKQTFGGSNKAWTFTVGYNF